MGRPPSGDPRQTLVDDGLSFHMVLNCSETQFGTAPGLEFSGFDRRLVADGAMWLGLDEAVVRWAAGA